MPLVKGHSNRMVDAIRELIHSGRPKNQAIAIAMTKAGKVSRKKKKR